MIQAALRELGEDDLGEASAGAEPHRKGRDAIFASDTTGFSSAPRSRRRITPGYAFERVPAAETCSRSPPEAPPDLGGELGVCSARSRQRAAEGDLPSPFEGGATAVVAPWRPVPIPENSCPRFTGTGSIRCVGRT